MSRFFLITVCLCVVVAFQQRTVLAAEGDAYLDDSVKIMMRSGQGLDYRIVAMLPSGQKITVLETAGEWTKIQADTGQEGWVMSRYVSGQVPCRISFDALQQQYTEIAEKLSAIEQENSRLTYDNQEMKTRLEKLTRENGVLKDAAANRFIKWFLAGGGVLSLGFLVGYLVKRGRRQSYFL